MCDAGMIRWDDCDDCDDCLTDICVIYWSHPGCRSSLVIHIHANKHTPQCAALKPINDIRICLG